MVLRWFQRRFISSAVLSQLVRDDVGNARSSKSSAHSTVSLRVAASSARDQMRTLSLFPFSRSSDFQRITSGHPTFAACLIRHKFIFPQGPATKSHFDISQIYCHPYHYILCQQFLHRSEASRALRGVAFDAARGRSAAAKTCGGSQSRLTVFPARFEQCRQRDFSAGGFVLGLPSWSQIYVCRC